MEVNMRTLVNRLSPVVAAALILSPLYDCVGSMPGIEQDQASQQPLTEANVVVEGTAPTLPERLAKLTEELEMRRQELNIPGMAMAVVQGDELIYSHGFGSADLENGTPVTPETLFAIGSSTKAFTASLIGMLVDEGKMSWDDPVTKFLPYFELKIDTEDPEATVTIRDLLSHRTGFIGMDLLWAGGAVSREEILRTATRAEPWLPFREKFYYNNVTFLAAGWHQAQQRVLPGTNCWPSDFSLLWE